MFMSDLFLITFLDFHLQVETYFFKFLLVHTRKEIHILHQEGFFLFWENDLPTRDSVTKNYHFVQVVLNDYALPQCVIFLCVWVCMCVCLCGCDYILNQLPRCDGIMQKLEEKSCLLYSTAEDKVERNMKSRFEANLLWHFLSHG